MTEVRRVREARVGQALTCGILVQGKEFVVWEPLCVFDMPEAQKV